MIKLRIIIVYKVLLLVSGFTPGDLLPIQKMGSKVIMLYVHSREWMELFHTHTKPKMAINLLHAH